MNIVVKNFKPGIIYFMLLIVNVEYLNAQKLDISGKWNIKSQQSISGQSYSNGVPKELGITQNSDMISLDKIFDGENGDISIPETGNLNGRPFETRTALNKKKVITITFNPGSSSFSEVANIYDATDSSKLEHVSTDTWSLIGSELVLDHKDQNMTNGESWEEKATYTKQ